MHVICCYIRLYEYLIEAGRTDLFDMEDFKNKLTEQVSNNKGLPDLAQTIERH